MSNEEDISQQHAEVEVYNFMGETSLADLHEKRGFEIGPKTLDVFRGSNFFTVEALRTVRTLTFVFRKSVSQSSS